jgi:hypothetical protein
MYDEKDMPTAIYATKQVDADFCTGNSEAY